MPDPILPAKLQVFLAHSSKDKPKVRELYLRLKKDGFQPWLDREDLIPGQNWQREIPKAVRHSHVVLVCLSATAVNEAGYLHKEIKFALDIADQQPEDSIFLIPVRFEDCDVPERLSNLHWVDYFEEEGYERLLNALRFQARRLNITFQGVQPEPSVTTSNSQPSSVQERAELAVVSVFTSAPSPAETEQERLLHELGDPRTTHERRRDIGDRLNEIGDTRPGVGVREDGTPDIVWLPVAPGGNLEIEGQNYRVAPFYIAKYPVTYAQYEAFVQAKDGFNNPAWWQGLPKESQEQALSKQNNKRLNCPRDSITWYQSMAFARWLNQHLQGLKLTYHDNSSSPPLIIGENAEVRLPLEYEWQWAAQNGNEQRTYPWGEWSEGYANTSEANLQQTVAAGMYPQGAAACGALDMTGNVLEWCLNKHSEKDPYPVLRGGSFFNLSYYAACAYRFSFNPNLDFNFYGFRLVLGVT
jgi:hypothetical protein